MESTSLAATREKRSNAGNRMGAMIDKEEEDFYKSTYGGFFEEDNDNEYKSEDSESDDVDSDFDIDETDDVVDEGEEDEEGKKRKTGRLITRAYREPKRKGKESSSKRSGSKRLKTSSKTYLDEDVEDEESDNQEETSETETSFAHHLNTPTKTLAETHSYQSPHKSPINQKKSLRTSTQLKSKATQKRTKLAEEARKDRKRITVQYEELTQDELLREAKETEKLNKKSLERYEKLELEKSRKNKIIRKQITGPIIRYHSTTMPLVVDQTQSNVDKKCSRNFINFSEEDTFLEIFKLNKPECVTTNNCKKATTTTNKKHSICSISKLPARYFDPITSLPFSSTFAFKTLRESYYKQLEMLNENERTEEIQKFIDWRETRKYESMLNKIIKSETPLLSSDDS